MPFPRWIAPGAGLLFVGAALALTPGCGKSPTLDAKPLAKAHAELEHLAAEIKEDFQADEPAEADPAIHAVGRILKELPAMAKQAGVASEEEAKQIHADLMDAFSKLDAAAHKNEPLDWDEVGQTIDAALAKVKSWLPAGVEPPPIDDDLGAEDHDHADGDHDADHADADHADEDHADADHDDGDHE